MATHPSVQLTQTVKQRLANARASVGVLSMLALISAGHLVWTCLSINSAIQLRASQEAANAAAMRAVSIYNAEQINVLGYMLDGDVRKLTILEDLRHSMHEIPAGNDEQNKAVADLEQQWYAGFAQPLIEQRKALDAGHGTIAQLQVRYLQLDSKSWEAKFNEVADDMDEPGDTYIIRGLRDQVSHTVKVRITIASLICIASLLTLFLALRDLKRLSGAKAVSWS
jgi:hypothetical protein